MLELLEAFLTQRVMETAEGWRPEEGTPQGAVVSPLLSNIYLDPLDQQMAKQGYEMIRYADDCAPRAQRAEEGPMCVTARLMRVGPSEPAYRSRFQTTSGGYGQKPWS